MSSTATASRKSTHPLAPYVALILAVLGGSTAAILIRLAQDEGVPSLLVALGRMGLSSLLMAPFALRHMDAIRKLQRRHVLLMLIAGFWLAVHFTGYITALEYTSVLMAQVLVLASPLWVAALEFLFLKQKPNTWIGVGMLLAIGGGIVIAIGGGDGGTSSGDNPLLGAALASLGAFSVAFYLIIGRQVRNRLPLIPYVSLVYGCGAFFTAIFIALSGTQVTGYSAEGYFWVFMVMLFPQMIGHNGINYALRFFAATYVSIAQQLIAVFAALLAYIIFGEIPTWLQITGSAVLLTGVIVASLGEQKQSESETESEAKPKQEPVYPVSENPR